MILEGRVRVNGVLRENPSFPVNPEKAKIEIDGIKTQAAPWKTLLLHKPRGTVTTRKDEKGRPTVFDCLKPPEPGLHAVGRLDWATSGLIILTNDTRVSSYLTDPINGVFRTYIVTARGKVLDSELEKKRAGIRDQDDFLQLSQAKIIKQSGKESQILVKLSEGKNREIRRLFLAVGHEVTKLKRIAYGDLELGDLGPGKYRFLTALELLKAFPGIPLNKTL